MSSKPIAPHIGVVLIVLVSVPAATAGSDVQTSRYGSGSPTQELVHGAHVSAESQVISDGTVRVDSVDALGDGIWVVLHSNTDGKPGETVYGTKLLGEGVFRKDVEVNVSDEHLQGWSERTVWVTLYVDDGDGSFEPEEDQYLPERSRDAATAIGVKRSDDGNAYVLSNRRGLEEITSPTVTVRTVTTNREAHLVAFPIDGATSEADAVGSTFVDPGRSEDVEIDLSEQFYQQRPNHFGVRVVLFVDDGDGEFDDDDAVWTVDGRPIQAFTYADKAEPTTTATETVARTTGEERPTIQTPSTSGDSSPASTSGGLEVKAIAAAGLSVLGIGICLVTWRRRNGS